MVWPNLNSPEVGFSSPARMLEQRCDRQALFAEECDLVTFVHIDVEVLEQYISIERIAQVFSLQDLVTCCTLLLEDDGQDIFWWKAEYRPR